LKNGGGFWVEKFTSNEDKCQVKFKFCEPVEIHYYLIRFDKGDNSERYSKTVYSDPIAWTFKYKDIKHKGSKEETYISIEDESKKNGDYNNTKNHPARGSREKFSLKEAAYTKEVILKFTKIRDNDY